MTRLSAPLALLACALSAQQPKPETGAAQATASLLDVKRIYVGQLTGGAQATALRELIIASLDSTKLFILTDKEDRADAVLKGAASGHDTLGKSSSGTSVVARASGLYGGNSLSENESHHSRERKHEAFASVRLCNKDGDVLWSTTQESLGAKFRGASADVAAKIARQIALDYDKALRADEAPPAPTPQ
jgi:hypothetical protein